MKPENLEVAIEVDKEVAATLNLADDDSTIKQQPKTVGTVGQSDTRWYIFIKTARHQPRNRLLLSSAPMPMAQPKPSLSIPEAATHHQHQKWRSHSWVADRH